MRRGKRQKQQIDTNFKKVQKSFEPSPPNRQKNKMTFQFPTTSPKQQGPTQTSQKITVSLKAKNQRLQHAVNLAKTDSTTAEP